ncbi:hypothetical protein GE061_015615 [Apolygus lucorum]|uniref:Osiris 10 n=1 Tax=Apolygus lucorum TaxID=248454 RepID=A0A6A4JHM5_APOLU|nr:hypothetical protein GE061_015615 [Apolygus lucorum]
MVRAVLAAQIVLVAAVRGVTFPKGQSSGSSRNSRTLFPQEIWKDGEDELGVCLRSGDPLLPCITSGAFRSLESAKTSAELDIGEGLKLIQDNDLGFTYDDGPVGDPREARTLFDNFGLYMQQRYLQWDLDFVYPGLLMRVGPSNRGTLHFLMDQRRVIDDRSLSTSRLLVKRTILPVLLGFKMNVISLVPLLIGALILLIKKAVFLSKLSLLASGFALLRPHVGSIFGGSGSGSVYGNSGHPSVYEDSGSGSFGGGGLGSFAGPTKHVIIDRPVEWFGREDKDIPLTA